MAGLLPFLLRIYDFGAGSTAFAWLLLALAISWLGATGAYFAGRAFGRRKLYPVISPNKTVEGAIGGLLCAAGGVLVFRAVALPDLSVRDAVLLGVVGCTLGIVGDLAESLLKRTFGVKDSGRIMPGHGGLLDRIDAVMFVAPFVYAYVVWFTPLLGVR